MAGEARDRVLSEVDFVVRFNRQHHLHHLPGSLFLRLVITFPNPFCDSCLWVFALLHMTEIAVHAEGRCHKIHQQKKL
jgi:hypothetical protein